MVKDVVICIGIFTLVIAISIIFGILIAYEQFEEDNKNVFIVAWIVTALVLSATLTVTYF